MPPEVWSPGRVVRVLAEGHPVVGEVNARVAGEESACGRSDGEDSVVALVALQALGSGGTLGACRA